MPVGVGILDDDLVALLQEPHTTGVAGVGLGGGAGGVGHRGAGHPGHVVHQDLEGVDLVVVKVVYLRVDEVNPRRSNPDSSVLDRKFPLHLHPPGPPGDCPVTEDSVPDQDPASPLPPLLSSGVSLQMNGSDVTGRVPLSPGSVPHRHSVPRTALSHRVGFLLSTNIHGAHVGI